MQGPSVPSLSLASLGVIVLELATSSPSVFLKRRNWTRRVSLLRDNLSQRLHVLALVRDYSRYALRICRVRSTYFCKSYMPTSEHYCAEEVEDRVWNLQVSGLFCSRVSGSSDWRSVVQRSGLSVDLCL